MFEFGKSDTVLGSLPSHVLLGDSQAVRCEMSISEACNALLSVPVVTLKCTGCLKAIVV